MVKKFRVTLKSIKNESHHPTLCPIAVALQKTYPECRVHPSVIFLDRAINIRVTVGPRLEAWITNYDTWDIFIREQKRKPVLPITIGLNLETERIEIVD